MSTTDIATPTPAPTGPARPNRALLVIGVVLGTLAAGWATLHLVDWVLADTQTTHETYAPSGELELVADGDVRVVAADGDIEVDLVAKSGLRSPEYSVEERGDRLVLTHRCDWWLTWSCSGSFDVTVPAGTEVTVRTSNGDVEAAGLTTDIDLDSNNGSVVVGDVAGRVLARSSNGSVTVDEAAGDVTATSSNGTVVVSGAGGRVTASSSNGDVVVDGAAGVTATSSNGTVEVRGAGGNVRAESSNGNVTVFGQDEPVALTINSSNGSQTIDGPTDPEADRTVRIRSSNGDVAYLTE